MSLGDASGGDSWPEAIGARATGEIIERRKGRMIATIVAFGLEWDLGRISMVSIPDMLRIAGTTVGIETHGLRSVGPGSFFE